MALQGKSACPKCKEKDWKKDNLVTFDNGSQYCFACGYSVKRGKEMTTENTERPSVPLKITGTYQALPDRKISEKIATLYGCRFDPNFFGKEVYIYEYQKQGEVVSLKRRLPNKEFPWEQYNKDVEMFGQHLTQDTSRPLIITEGEFDAMALAEINTEIQAVSIPLGAQGALTTLKAHMEFLSQFSEIILWFDNDLAGKQAIEKCRELAMKLKLKFVVNGTQHKDANDILLNDHDALHTVNTILEMAIPLVPPGISLGSTIDFSHMAIADPEGREIPFPILHKMIRGLKKGRLIVLGAGSGCGKSTFMREMAYHLMLNDPTIKIANIFLEENQTFTLQAYAAMEANIPEWQVAENPALIPDIAKKAKALLGHDRFAFIDHFGSMQNYKLLDLLEYLAAKKFDLIILDHISIVISGLKASKEGERKDIDMLMTKLRELIARTGVTVIAASHLKRLDGESGFENGKHVNLNSFRGSGTLTQIPDIVLGLERDTQSKEANKCIVRILKNRVTGKLGEADTLVYLEEKGRLLEINRAFAEM